MVYSELETKQKAILVEKLAGAYHSRKMYVDDWMRKHDPEVAPETLEIKNEMIADLIRYLKLRK